MKKIVFAMSLMTAVLTATSCATSKNTSTSKSPNHPTAQQLGIKTEGKEVRYAEARHYFSIAPGNAQQQVLITSQSQLDSLFSPAAVMGKDGQPTKIDFTRQMAIGMTLPEGNDQRDIRVISLTREGDALRLVYNIKYGELGMSYTIKPMLFLVVDRMEGVGRCEFDEIRF